MTFAEVFMNLEQKNKGIYKSQNFSVLGRYFSTVPITKHQLTFDHNSTTINVNCDLGNHNLVEIYFTLKDLGNFPEVKIYSLDNFLRLINRKKSPWKIKCKDNLIKDQLIQLLNKNGLSKLANETRFEPETTIKKTKTNYEVKSSYYLGFDNKELSIEPMLEFTKDLIDYITEFSHN